MNKLKIILYTILIILSLWNVLFPVVKNWKSFTEPFNAKLYEQKYNKSQYVIPQSKNPISDRDLYIHAAYKYATGLNPVLINSDHPPLGKYIIGGSIILFNNFNYISLITGVGVMILVYLTVLKITQSHLLSALGICMLSLDTMFKDQITTGPYLDIYQAFFLIAYFYIFTFWEKKKNTFRLIILGIMLGCLAATKFYFPAIILLGVTGLYFLVSKNTFLKTIQYLSIIFISAVITYTATYTNYFLQGNSLRSFVGAQKWIFLYWENNSVREATVFGSILPFVLFNQWKIWWGNKGFIHYDNWSIFWPVFFITGIFSVGTIFKKYPSKLVYPGLLLALWITTIFLYLCLVPISPRYLMLLYFPIYILTPFVVKLMLNKYV